MNNYQYFIPVAIGTCGLVLCLSLSLFAFISMCHRGSGRAVATPPPEEQVHPGDGRR